MISNFIFIHLFSGYKKFSFKLKRLVFSVLSLIIFTQILFSNNLYADSLKLSNTEKTINLSNDLEFSYQHFAAIKQAAAINTVALWILPGYLHKDRFYDFSQRLSQLGIEVWLVDITDNLFLQKSVNSTRQLTGQYIAELITVIHQQTNKNVLLVAESYSAIPVLRAARLWQNSTPSKRYLTGAVLFSPNLFVAIPSLGEQPKFVDIANNTSIPILLYQSEKSNTRGQLPELISRLQNSNASVFTSVLKDAIAIFYLADSSPETLHNLEFLPKKIVSSLTLLQSSPLPIFNNDKTVTPPNTTTVARPRARPLDSALVKYTAKNKPLNIKLQDVYGKDFVKTNYKNKITIVNFWASWCKPCLEEIPSLNRLQATMKNKPFEIISINYGEKPETIKKFMKQVRIDFPVLIDESGEQAVKWNVYAFPSTFVIGPDGEFHYGVNAGILWDTPEVINTLNSLY